MTNGTLKTIRLLVKHKYYDYESVNVKHQGKPWENLQQEEDYYIEFDPHTIKKVSFKMTNDGRGPRLKIKTKTGSDYIFDAFGQANERFLNELETLLKAL